jgi:hypothetical protein
MRVLLFGVTLNCRNRNNNTARKRMKPVVKRRRIR